MTVTFFAVREVDKQWKPLWVCTNQNCNGFCIDCTKHNLNQSNGNARDLIEWLDLMEFCDDGHLFGSMDARELVARCQRRLWDEPCNHDPALPPESSGGPGTGMARLSYSGRAAGYLRGKTEELLFIAKCAGEHCVAWD